MADLSSLMQVAPYAGGFMAGQQNVADLAQKNVETDRVRQLVNSLQIANQQSSQMNPLLLQQQELTNQGLQEGLPGITAKSRQSQLDADLKAGTLDSDIAAGNATNKAKISKSHAETQAAGGQLIMGAGLRGRMAMGNGPGAVQAAVASYLKEQGIDENNSFYKFAITNASNPDALVAYGDSLVKHSAAYMQALDSENVKSETSKAVANIHEAGATARNDANIQAGKYKKTDKTSFESYYSTLKTARDKHAALTDEATKARIGGDNNAATNFMKRAEAIRPQAEAEIAAINLKPGAVNIKDLSGGQIPTNPAPTIAPPDPGTPAGPAPARAAQATPPGRVRVIGPDGKSGTIPANQLQEALSQGFKQAN